MHAIFIRNTFINNTRQKVKQHLEAEFLTGGKINREYCKKQAKSPNVPILIRLWLTVRKTKLIIKKIVMNKIWKDLGVNISANTLTIKTVLLILYLCALSNMKETFEAEFIKNF